MTNIEEDMINRSQNQKSSLVAGGKSSLNAISISM